MTGSQSQDDYEFLKTAVKLNFLLGEKSRKYNYFTNTQNSIQKYFLAKF